MCGYRKYTQVHANGHVRALVLVLTWSIHKFHDRAGQKTPYGDLSQYIYLEPDVARERNVDALRREVTTRLCRIGGRAGRPALAGRLRGDWPSAFGRLAVCGAVGRPHGETPGRRPSHFFWFTVVNPKKVTWAAAFWNCLCGCDYKLPYRAGTFGSAHINFSVPFAKSDFRTDI